MRGSASFFVRLEISARGISSLRRIMCDFRKIDDIFALWIPGIARSGDGVSSLKRISGREGVFSANLMILRAFWIPGIARSRDRVSSLLWISAREGVFCANLMILRACGFQELPDRETEYHYFCGFRAKRARFP